MILATLYKDLHHYLSYRFQALLNLLALAMAVLSYFFMGEALSLKAVQHGYFEFVLIGVATAALLTAVSGGLANQLLQELQSGTLEILLATRPRRFSLLLAMQAFSLVQALVIFLTYLTMAMFFFTQPPTVAMLTQAAVITLLALLPFLALSWLAAALLLHLRRGNPIQWLLGSLQILVGGVYFPVSALPEGLQQLARTLPMMHAIEAMRATLIEGRSWSELKQPLIYLTLLAVILLPLALAVLAASLKKLQRHGSFTQH